MQVLNSQSDSYAVVFVTGGHESMLGIPEDRNVRTILNWAHEKNYLQLAFVTDLGLSWQLLWITVSFFMMVIK